MSTLPPDSEHARTSRPAPQLRPEAVRRGPHAMEVVAPVAEAPKHPSRQSTEREVKAAVETARAAQETWRRMSLDERIAALTRAAKDMLRRRAEVIALSHAEMGKVDVEGLFNEALGPLDTLNGWAKVLRQSVPRKRVGLNPLSFPKKRAHVDMVPRGVVGIIAPWNFPSAGLYRSLFPALLSGNAVVLKPSEYTPNTSGWLAQRLAAELPEGVIQVVTGDGAVGQMLIDAGIDACVFTGSPASGRKVAVRCAERGIPSSVEMGGKDPAIVLADCDLPRTVAGITHWALSNCGQACGAIEVAFVEATIADQFVAAMKSAFSRLNVAAEPYADLGPLANQRQFDLVSSQVEDAKAKGASVACGGVALGELRYAPTLLDHCDERMAVVTDETFGPVLAVIRVEGAAEAIRRANKGRYGLGASIWTKDIARAERLAERLEVGVVNVNNHAFTGAIATLPWSGTRETGFGVANSALSLPTFVRPRATVVDENDGPEPFWMPYDKNLWALGQVLSDAQLMRVQSAWKLPLLMRKRIQAIKKFYGW
ncbi:MAG: aldehyde dehydrogenase family protein [Deltaproteobacteria bacterium]|nr:aldehyde dehydrogenase family protein [Deltaproteobacteria bacterium]